MAREYNVIIEQDEEGCFVGTVPEIPACHTQAKSLDKLMTRMREAIQVCLDGEVEPSGNTFVGVHRIVIDR
jgi:predicted RNase H-like HicB family nuclease